MLTPFEAPVMRRLAHRRNSTGGATARVRMPVRDGTTDIRSGVTLVGTAAPQPVDGEGGMRSASRPRQPKSGGRQGPSEGSCRQPITSAPPPQATVVLTRDPRPSRGTSGTPRSRRTTGLVCPTAWPSRTPRAATPTSRPGCADAEADTGSSRWPSVRHGATLSHLRLSLTCSVGGDHRAVEDPVLHLVPPCRAAGRALTAGEAAVWGEMRDLVFQQLTPRPSPLRRGGST
jgi:hypothetical protein